MFAWLLRAIGFKTSGESDGKGTPSLYRGRVDLGPSKGEGEGRLPGGGANKSLQANGGLVGAGSMHRGRVELRPSATRQDQRGRSDGVDTSNRRVDDGVDFPIGSSSTWSSHGASVAPAAVGAAAVFASGRGGDFGGGGASSSYGDSGSVRCAEPSPSYGSSSSDSGSSDSCSRDSGSSGGGTD